MYNMFIEMEVPKKRRKLSINIPQQPTVFVWESPFNKEGEVTVSTTELGDGATSRVYLGGWTARWLL